MPVPLVPVLGAAALGVAGGVGNAIGDSATRSTINNMGSQNSYQNNNQNSYQSNNGQPNLDTKIVLDYLDKKGVFLSAQDQAKLSQEQAKQAGNDNLELQYKALQLAAPLDNAIANAQTQRAMVVNAQKFNADNVANQLRNLDSARSTSANAISNAFNTTASMFR